MLPLSLVRLRSETMARGFPGFLQFVTLTWRGAIDILETRSTPHKDTAIADITSKMITEMTCR